MLLMIFTHMVIFHIILIRNLQNTDYLHQQVKLVHIVIQVYTYTVPTTHRAPVTPVKNIVAIYSIYTTQRAPVRPIERICFTS